MPILNQMTRIFRQRYGRNNISRSQMKVKHNLGVIGGGGATEAIGIRDQRLEVYDAYYEARQYNHLPLWDDCTKSKSEYIPIRRRRPRLQLNISHLICSRVSSKLVGNKHFPKIRVEEDPDTQEYFNLIKKASKLPSRLIEPTKRMLASGSVLVRFYITGASIQVEHYLGKYCYPEFDDQQRMNFVKIQYVYTDPKDLDEKGNPKKKWFRLDLGQLSDVLYDNPDYESGEEPTFEVVESTQHALGFVQAEWLRTAQRPFTPDGYSIVEDVLGFIDELNYNFSQSSQAISYNQDPMLTIKGMDETELDGLIRSSAKAWNLGREGEAGFLESTLSGTEVASAFRDKVRLNIQDISRVVLLDPEKMVTHAQSGRAMEVLHGPLIELIDEIRPAISDSIKALISKIAVANLIQANRGQEVPITIPQGYKPLTLEIDLVWPPIFQQTLEDIKSKVMIATQAAGASIISRETALRYLSEEFGVENVEEELAKVNTQPIISPFGGGFF